MEEMESTGENPKKITVVTGIVVIVIIALALAVAASNNFFGLFDDNKTSVLIISDSAVSVSPHITEAFHINSELVNYRIRTAYDLSISPADKIKGYDVIMLAGLNYVPRNLAEAISANVNGGGKLIVIKDAGIREGVVMPSGQIEGYAPDVLGWESLFGDILPVNCEKTSERVPGCIDKLYVSGKLYRADEEHELMQGFAEIPQEPDSSKDFEILNVLLAGKELAYIKGNLSQKPYPGIAEKNSGLGKVLYFNYDPGTTPGLLMQTIDYLE